MPTGSRARTPDALTLEILPNPKGGWTINATNYAAQESETRYSSAGLDEDPQASALCDVVTRLVREHMSKFAENPGA